MFLNKKVLAAAVVGSLFAGNALATDFTAGSSAAIAASAGIYAKEIKTGSTSGTAVTLSAAAGTQLKWKSGYAYSAGEVRYVRIEAPANVLFQSATPTAVAGTTGAAPTLGNVNGVGTNVITFSVTGGAGGTASDAAFTLNIPVKITSITDANVAISLYDQPSQAQAGGDAGKITGASYSAPYLTFKPSYTLTTATPGSLVASVDTLPPYVQFKGAGYTPTSGGLVGAGVTLATASYGGVTPLTPAGAAITLNDLFDFTETSLTFKGDFSLISNASAPLYNATAAARIAGGAGSYIAGSLTDSEVSFDLGTPAVGTTSIPGSFGFTSKLAAKEIQASDYTVSLNAVSADPTAYTVSDITDVAVGSITRDGVTLQAPLVQLAGSGWLSRLVLTNTGGLDRNYTIKVLSETGVALTTGNLTGTVPATGTKVVDLSTVLTGVTGGSLRGTLVVTVAGPNGDIQGLYQIVNSANGALSNHVLVRPGSN